MDGIGGWDPVTMAEIMELQLMSTAEELERALGGAEPLQWVGPKDAAAAPTESHVAPAATPDPKALEEAPEPKAPEEVPEPKAKPEFFDLREYDASDLIDDPLFSRLEESLVAVGLAIDDLPGPADSPELTELLKELGFKSAIERTKLRRAIRERHSWSLGALDQEQPPAVS
uniref:Uncharacterized protein n=2 Tax=Alexandrium monilatum TaxID=311494 RepID=A0A7S4RW61_9DINO